MGWDGVRSMSTVDAQSLSAESASRGAQTPPPRMFWYFKRGFDVGVSLLALPIVAMVALWLLLLNPLLNRGSLFFTQKRMGRHETEFTILKFRTMVPNRTVSRGAGDPVEVDRITPLGYWLRRLRIDELPQVINVLRGEMSLIGPRPDYIEYARDYTESVPAYRHRHVVRPGISGYAQVRLGYAEGYALAETKAKLDLYYIENAGWRLESWILARTFAVLLSGFGAR
jgi:lipopolysaccharide/colanic/teichoic acid biosynthesis glycosyltransferase